MKGTKDTHGYLPPVEPLARRRLVQLAACARQALRVPLRRDGGRLQPKRQYSEYGTKPYRTRGRVWCCACCTIGRCAATHRFEPLVPFGTPWYPP
jgi:hypothetical protein